MKLLACTACNVIAGTVVGLAANSVMWGFAAVFALMAILAMFVAVVEAAVDAGVDK